MFHLFGIDFYVGYLFISSFFPLCLSLSLSFSPSLCLLFHFYFPFGYFMADFGLWCKPNECIDIVLKFLRLNYNDFWVDKMWKCKKSITKMSNVRHRVQSWNDQWHRDQNWSFFFFFSPIQKMHNTIIIKIIDCNDVHWI